MNLTLQRYTPAHEHAWDEFCTQAGNATLLHTRRFLSYHGNRFVDTSLLIFEDERLIGLLPAAVDPTDPCRIISHPGATFGGLVHQGRLYGTRMLSAMQALCAHYRAYHFTRLLYKAIPYHYLQRPAQDDLYALFRCAARRIRCDLSCAIDLTRQRRLSERRRRSLKKAQKFVQTSATPERLAAFWAVLDDNLARRHDACPVHSLAEITLLRDRFPEHIVLRTATIDGRVEAGVLLFNTADVWHAQYIAASARAHETCALDLVFDTLIAEARATGIRYFDFGTSNEQAGQVLNEGLYRFKSEFGGSGVVHEFYELELENPQTACP